MLSHLIRSKGLFNIARRGFAILRDVDGSGRAMRRTLLAFADLLARYQATATFPVPALTLSRHPAILRELLAHPAGIELAVHGHRHIDLSLLSPAEQAEQLRLAAAQFRAAGIPFSGFRAPYLRWNEALLANLSAAGYRYDSSRSIAWPVVDTAELTPAQQADFARLLEFSRPLPAEAFPALPSWHNGLLEIPMSFPDDELLLHRLELTDTARIVGIWQAALDQCHGRGELFVLQLHPERFLAAVDAVERLLRHAQTLRPAVWLASLAEVAAWWHEKQTCSAEIAPSGNGWEVVGHGAGARDPADPGRGRAGPRAGPGMARTTPCPTAGLPSPATAGLVSACLRSRRSQ